jgi:hypothetical protein
LSNGLKSLWFLLLVGVAGCRTDTASGDLAEATCRGRPAVDSLEKARAAGVRLGERTLLAASSARDPVTFCCLVERSALAEVVGFLEDLGFVTPHGTGWDYDFSRLGAFDHRQIGCLLERITSVPVDPQKLGPALRIAGQTLGDEGQRAAFIRRRVLVNSDVAVRELLLLSHLLRLAPSRPEVAEALQSTIRLAEPAVLRTFLNRCGYLRDDRFTDGETAPDPDAIAHLAPEIRRLLLARAGLAAGPERQPTIRDPATALPPLAR